MVKISPGGFARKRSDMKTADFVTIYTSYNDIDVVSRILPSVLLEAERTNTAVIVHDCSDVNIENTWEWYRKQGEARDFFYVMSRQMPFAISRNMCLSLAIEMYAPQYVCMLEDDHGYRPGAIERLRVTMAESYGVKSPNGLRYGLFSLCPNCWGPTFRRACVDDGRGNLYPSAQCPPMWLGGANSCCRAAPTSHWISVLKGYDPDEYATSFYQTRNLNFRNYNRGFTTMYLGDGRLVCQETRPGLGAQTLGRRFDNNFTASDSRSSVRQKK